MTVPGGAGEPERVLRWGAQLDIRPITTDGEVTEQAVAGYVAKYATKAAECVGALDRRVNPAQRLIRAESEDLPDHHDPRPVRV